MKTNQSRGKAEGGEQETQTWPQYTTIYNLNQMQLNDQRRRHKSPASWAADSDTDTDTDTARATGSDVDNAGSREYVQSKDSKGRMQYVIK